MERRCGPHLGIGGEVHLELGVGEHDRADVAALEHPAAVVGHPRPLAPDHLGAHRRVGGHDADGTAHLGAADLDGGVDAVDGHAVGSQLDLDVAGQAAHDLGVAGVDPAAQGGEGDRAVHGAGVEVLEAEAGGQRLGHGGLARPGRSVDGDDPHGRTVLTRAGP